jgi:AraC-like DNA-binding protein
MPRRDERNKTKYWCSKWASGMSLLHADFTTHNYGPHTHAAFVIAATEVGGAEICSARGAERVCPSVLFVSNPEERQSARMGRSTRWSYRSIYLADAAIGLLSRSLGISEVPYFTQSMIKDAGLIDRFCHMHRALEANEDSFHVEELLIDTLGSLFRRHGSGGGRTADVPRDDVIAGRTIEVMRARFDENLRLDELASTAGFTSFQLIGLFKRCVGLTPHAYLVQLRLNAACRHLRRGHSLAEGAQAAGFFDQSAMTKHFKRCYGITPLQFANAVRTG